MRVQFTRPHQGAGSMGSMGNDVKVVDLPDGSPIPDGGIEVAETVQPQDWTWDQSPVAGGLGGGMRKVGS